MMSHKFLRAVGFSNLTDRRQIQALVSDSLSGAVRAALPQAKDGARTAVFYRNYSSDENAPFGIAVCGSYDEKDNFLFDYYFPYAEGTGHYRPADGVSVERLAGQEAYAGIVDEPRVGVSLIFYVRNMIAYMVRLAEGGRQEDALTDASLTFSALSDGGTILLPLFKSKKDKVFAESKAKNRRNMIASAKHGNEAAIESLTLEDMDTYTAVSKKIRDSDVFTLVDTYFMPFGVECDQYSVLGEIEQVLQAKNEKTQETIYRLRLNINGLRMHLCVNEADLTGEPLTGRRFKGNIWLLGQINYRDGNIPPEYRA